jgi:hypothetical protein
MEANLVVADASVFLALQLLNGRMLLAPLIDQGSESLSWFEVSMTIPFRLMRVCGILWCHRRVVGRYLFRVSVNLFIFQTACAA